MSATRDDLWTIEELSAEAALALSVDYEGQDSGRVREVPDARTIRYYTTLGLLDRPAVMRGRTALYGWRHLLQLVAIKRLQAKGQTLAELQHQLVGLTDSELSRIARVPGAGAVPPPQRRSDEFWTERPAPVEKREPAPALSDAALQGVALTDGVTLLLSAARPLETDDVEAIRTVAGPLLKLLDKRRLL